MDKLTIFNSGTTEVSLSSENNIDNVVEKQGEILRELKLTRKGNEAFVYGEEVEDSEEVDLEDLDEEEVNA